MAEVHLFLLGAAAARIDGTRIALGPRLAALVALAALGGPLPRSRAVEWLYPELGAEAARRNLRQLLFKQRPLVSRLLHEQGEAMLLAEGVQVDALQPPDEAALTEPEPVLLDGLSASAPFDDWLAGHRQRRRLVRTEAMAALSQAHESAGRLNEAIRLAVRLSLEWPASEHVHRRLMRLHFLRGDRSAALAAFDLCEQHLKHELGARPCAETLALLKLIEGGAAPTLPAPLRPLPVSVLRPPRLTGRGAELAAVQQAWLERRVPLLRGEAGIGKSRLLQELAQGRRAVVVGCRPGDERQPRALLARLLAALPPADDGELPPTGDAARLCAALVRLLNRAAAEERLLLAVDDLHDIDSASAELLMPLIDGTDRAALDWVLASRPLPADPPARQVLEELAAADLLGTIDVAPLAPADVEALVESLALPVPAAPERQAAAVRRAGGNPLFVLEMIKALLQGGADAAALPARVSGVIGRRLARLGPQATRLMRCAAVAGADFDANLASQVLGVRAIDLADAWSELQDAQVLRGEAFAHDLVMEVAAASVPVPVAQQLHREIAGFLAAAAAAPARLAWHWLQGGRPALALPPMLAAARALHAGMLLSQAQRMYEAAAGVAQQLDERRTGFDIQIELAQLADQLRDYPAMHRHLDRATALVSSPRELGRLGLKRIAGLAAEGRIGEAVAAYEQVAPQLDELAEADLLAALRGVLGAAHVMPGELARALPWFDAAQPYFESHPEHEHAMEFFGNHAVLLDSLGRSGAALAMHRRSLAIAEQRGEWATAVAVLSNMAVNRADHGRMGEALTLSQQADDLARRHGEAGELQATHSIAMRGSLLRDLGRYAEALAVFEGELHRLDGEADGYGRATGLRVNLGRTWLHLGQYARATQEFRAALSGEERLRFVSAKAHVGLACVALATGAPADEHFDSAWRLAEGGRFVTLSQLRLTRLPGEPAETALAAALQIHHDCQAADALGLAVFARAMVADAARRCGRHDEAATHAQAALQAMQTHDPDEFYRGEVWRLAARAFEAAGWRAAHRQALVDALAWVRDCANQQVPDEFRESFLHRNPANRELFAAAVREGLA